MSSDQATDLAQMNAAVCGVFGKGWILFRIVSWLYLIKQGSGRATNVRPGAFVAEGRRAF
jgi:hypothetical protein